MTDDEFKLAVVELALAGRLWRGGMCPFTGAKPFHSELLASYIFRSGDLHNSNTAFFVVCKTHVRYFLGETYYPVLEFEDLKQIV